MGIETLVSNFGWDRTEQVRSGRWGREAARSGELEAKVWWDEGDHREMICLVPTPSWARELDRNCCADLRGLEKDFGRQISLDDVPDLRTEIVGYLSSKRFAAAEIERAREGAERFVNDPLPTISPELHEMSLRQARETLEGCERALKILEGTKK